MPSDVIRIEVVFALPHRFWRRTVEVPAGTGVAVVAARSGLDRVCREQTGRPPDALGIFGRRVNPDHPVRSGDRVALYRPLVLDPRERRRERVRRS